jgi:iron complex outermembrane receptor protein
VTGSNIPTAEEVGPNPVDTYRRDDITRLGVRTPTDLILRIPASTGSNTTENNTNGGDGSTRISLRGIDPKETLVLQDGRRLAQSGSASVDFNQFPLGLIDHIDILKDGASPVYGADAVAGVVNVFLIHKFRGVEVYASYGNTNLGFANDRGEEAVYLLAGTGDDKTNIVVYAGLYNAAAIFSRDTDISQHDADVGGVQVNRDNRSGNLAGRVTAREFLGLAVQPFKLNLLTPTPHASANQFDNTQYTTRFSAAIPRERSLFNFGDFTPLIAPTDREFLYGSVDRDICDKYLTVFADFRYFRQFFDGGLAPSPFAPDIWVDSVHGINISPGGASFSVPIQNAFNPFTVADYTSPGGFDTRFPLNAPSAAPPGTQFTTGVRFRSVADTGLRFDKIRTDNYLFTGGLKGNLGEFANAWDELKTWEWEFGLRYADNHSTETLGPLVNNYALRARLLDTDPATAFNPFGIGKNSAFVRQQVYVTGHNTQETVLITEDLTLRGDMFNLPGGAVRFAVGGLHLTNTFFNSPDSLIAAGQTVAFTNQLPTRGQRDEWAIFQEVRVPVTGPTWNFPGAYSLELGYAEREEWFSDFGDSQRPKFDVRWQPIDQSLTLRAAYIEAFHAPSLFELFAGATQSFPGVVDTCSTCGTDPQVAQTITGNKNLTPETAYEYTYGAVLTPGKWWSPLQGLTLSADFIHIDLRQFITFLDPQFLIDHAGPQDATGRQTFGPAFVQRDGVNGPISLLFTPYQNLGKEVLSAWDFEVVEIFDTTRFGHGDWGTFTATWNETYLADVDVQAIPGGKRLTAVGKFGGGFQGPGGGGSFTHNRWYASLFYDGPSGSWMQGIDAGAVVHYIGQYWDNEQFQVVNVGGGGQAGLGAGNVPPGEPRDRKVREWTTLDLIVNYTFNLPPPAAQSEVAGYAKDGGKNVKMKDGKEKNVMPVSTAEYNPCGWRAWLNNTTITLGVDNVFDSEPPMVLASFENFFDEQTANPKGRLWYVAIKKRF